MIRLLLRASNAPILILLAAIGIAIQTSLFGWPPLSYFQPDIILMIVIWCALKRTFAEGGILTLLLGNIAEIHSSSPQGAMMLIYMLIYLGVRAAIQVIVLPNRSALVMFTLVASILWKGLMLGLMLALGATLSSWKHVLIFVFPGAAIEAAVAIWVYPGLDRFDWITFKSSRAQQILEDELQLEGEGF